MPNAHELGIYGVAWVDDEIFVTVSADKKVKFWNLELENVKEILICGEEERKSLEYFIVGVACCQGLISCLCLNGEIKQINKG